MGVDKMGVDEMGVDEMGVDEMGTHALLGVSHINICAWTMVALIMPPHVHL